MDSIEKVIKNTNEENQDKVNWTNAWSGKYPVLKTYQDEIDIPRYANGIKKMLQELEETHGYSRRDAMLVLKDILYHEYKDNK